MLSENAFITRCVFGGRSGAEIAGFNGDKNDPSWRERLPGGFLAVGSSKNAFWSKLTHGFNFLIGEMNDGAEESGNLNKQQFPGLPTLIGGVGAPRW